MNFRGWSYIKSLLMDFNWAISERCQDLFRSMLTFTLEVREWIAISDHHRVIIGKHMLLISGSHRAGSPNRTTGSHEMVVALDLLGTHLWAATFVTSGWRDGLLVVVVLVCVSHWAVLDLGEWVSSTAGGHRWVYSILVMLLRSRSGPLLLNCIQIWLTWWFLLASSSTWHSLGLISLVWGSDARLGRLALRWLRGPDSFVMTMIHSCRLSNMRVGLSRLPLLLLVDHLVVAWTVPSAT